MKIHLFYFQDYDKSFKALKLQKFLLEKKTKKTTLNAFIFFLVIELFLKKTNSPQEIKSYETVNQNEIILNAVKVRKSYNA